METTELILPWGKEEMSLNLPENWHIAGILAPSSLPPVADPTAEIRRSLAEPIGSARLRALYRPGMRVVVVIDDGSRPTPQALMLPLVLEELARAGAPRDGVTLVPALGVHRAMLVSELAQRVGAQTLDGLNWENPDCKDPQHLEYLGVTQRGTPVWINKCVAEADLVVSIGCIEPHFIASFGGGYKNLVPGVAGLATIAHNHALNCSPATFNMVGRPIADNPMRMDLEDAAAKVKAPVFIVNAVLDSAQQLVRVVSGSPIAAHRQGCLTSQQLYGVQVSEPADVVIAFSHPMDKDFRQGIKALGNTVRAVRPGGVLITLVRAEEGIGVFGLANRKFPLSRGALKLLAPILLPMLPSLKIKGLGEEDRFFAYSAIQAMRRARLLMYAPTIPVEIQERMPFVEFTATVEQALTLAQQRFPRQAEVLVFPHGGITYPVIDEAN